MHACVKALAAAGMAAMCSLAAAQTEKPADAKPEATGQEKQDVKPEPASSQPRVEMNIEIGGESAGKIVLELDAEKAPITVHNFLQYVADGYYDGTVFHRVVPDFMVQGGGYTAEYDEKKQGLRPPIKNEWQNGLKNNRGTISMARLGGNPDSASSQFFINVVDNARLDQPQPDGAAYCVFGKVIEGMDVVDKIRDTPTTTHPKIPMGKVVPEKTVVIKSAKAVGNYDRSKLTATVEKARQETEKQAQQAKAQEQQHVDSLVQKLEKESGKKSEKTASGIVSVIMKEGTGATPKPTDTVEVHYTGTLLDGTKFDSSRDRGQSATFPLNRVIKGWTEGVGLMKVGERRTLIIPPDLAYGSRPPTPKIPPNSTLVFDVELIAIK